MLVSRHGRTTGNEQHLVQGWGDYPLSDSGRVDVEMARRYWQRFPVSYVITSPVHRAVETGQLLFGRVDDLDTGWAEISVPELAGMTTAEAYAARPDLCRPDGWPRPDAPKCAAAEHQDTVVARAVEALRRAAASVSAGETAAVVTHGSVLVGLLIAAARDSEPVANLQILQLEVDPAEGWELTAVHHPLSP